MSWYDLRWVVDLLLCFQGSQHHINKLESLQVKTMTIVNI